MSKRGIIGRVAQLAHADVGAVIGAAGNPRQAADELARDYSATIAEAGQAIANLAENRRITTDDQREDAEAAEMWAAAAAATSQTADELRAAGDAARADRFDGLARIALARELMAENDVEVSQHAIAAQTESVDTLRDGLSKMQTRLAELAHVTHGLSGDSGGPHDRHDGRAGAVLDVDVMDPATEVALFEDMVGREEAWLPGSEAPDLAHLRGNSIYQNEIEERLQGLKAARAMASALARANDQPFR